MQVTNQFWMFLLQVTNQFGMVGTNQFGPFLSQVSSLGCELNLLYVVCW